MGSISWRLIPAADINRAHLLCKLDPKLSISFPPLPSQLTAFAYKDYVSFGYVYIGLRGVEEMTREYNINIYAPTMLIFKEHIHKPADVIQVRENHLLSRRPSVYLSLQQISNH